MFGQPLYRTCKIMVQTFLLMLAVLISGVGFGQRTATTDVADNIPKEGEYLSKAPPESIYHSPLMPQLQTAYKQLEVSEKKFDKVNFISAATRLARLYELKGYPDSAAHFAERALNLIENPCNETAIILWGILSRGTAFHSAANVPDDAKKTETCDTGHDHLLHEMIITHLQKDEFKEFVEKVLELEDRLIRNNDSNHLRLLQPYLFDFFLLAGKPNAAAELMNHALDAHGGLASPWLAAENNFRTAQLLEAQGIFKSAEKHYESALTDYARFGALGQLGHAHLALARLKIKRNEFIAAEDLLNEVQLLISQSNNQLNHLTTNTLIDKTRLELALEHPETALSLAKQAILSAGNFNQRLLESEARALVAQISAELGLTNEAFDYQRSADLLRKEIFLPLAFEHFNNLRSTYAKLRTEEQNKPAITDVQSPAAETGMSQLEKYSWIGSLLLLLLVIGLLVYRDRNKGRSHRSLLLKNETIALQNKELLNTNEELNQAKIRAEAANVAKSNFLAITNHEIRTPLNGIMGMASLLSDSSLNKTQQEYVDSIIKSSENLLIILNDILDFSKLETGKLNLEVKLIDLDRLLDEVKMIFAKQARERNLIITKKIGNAGIKFFRGDILRIRQVLINLLSNAVKFTEHGTVKITVDVEELSKISPEEHNRFASLRFSIQDDGIGIGPEKQKTIFESFEQADSSTSRKYGGIGLGLTISKKLVELMGGKIGLQSQMNVGSTFYFTIPVVIPDINQKTTERAVNSPAIEMEEADENLPLAKRFPMRILLAEDNTFNKLYIEKLLEKFGYETVSHAENGHKVIELLGRERFDIILMDIQMPGKDGMQTTREIIETYGSKRPVIVAVTADSNNTNKEQYLDAGMDAFLSKPFKENELRSILEKYGKRVKENLLRQG